MDDDSQRRCRCQPCRCCYFKPCLPLRTATVIIASFELLWNLFGTCATGWMILFYENNVKRAVKGGFATKEDIQWQIFMEANDDGLRMLCASYGISSFMAFGLLLHADKRKKMFMVWWLLVMPNVTGLQIAAIYFFPFPYTHANSVVILLRIYFFWTVFCYVKELLKYPDGLPKPTPRAPPEVDEEENAETEDKEGNISTHAGSVGSRREEGDNVISTTGTLLTHHLPESTLPSDYIGNHSSEEYHHKHNDLHEYHHQHPHRSDATSSKNHEHITEEHNHHSSL